jgi:hypothetical protein
MSRTLERIMMAPTSVYSLFFGRMANGYISSIISSSLYLLVGLAVFHVRFGQGNPLSSLPVLVLGAIGTIAMGMLLAQARGVFTAAAHCQGARVRLARRATGNNGRAKAVAEALIRGLIGIPGLELSYGAYFVFGQTHSFGRSQKHFRNS